MMLLKLLMLPVSGPLSSATWAMRTVLEEAERQYYDETAIRRDMLALEELYRAGKLDEASFENAADALLQRLMEARAYRAEREQTGY